MVTHLSRLKSDHRPLKLSLLSEFIDLVKIWNKEVYGHIFTRKQLLTRKLEHIEFERDRTNSEFLKQIEMDMREELENVLHHKEILWRQKTRCDWRDFPSIAFPCLKDEDLNFLNRPVSNEEIKVVLFYMAPLKALGSDGFHALFYQSQWDHVGTSVCTWVKEVFKGKNIDSDLNNSLIVLIPQTQSPMQFSQFWPTSLCSVIYKLVMKIIANRVKVVFPRILAPDQVGFVVGRNIIDNIIIA
ncbi:hypothetical protein J1N35_007908 [Gossypium stocksii]|uniref:Reverse transcriptase domain-containing protein n=1 Tax=Gossypium stocksii TaxID=47602 RepID=A0A9D3W9B8_9ROSI|nr:hypothetical protein J1N35_007908 [Gossypium stocksii]